MRLKELRLKAGVTQAKLAVMANVGVDTIRKIEQGVHAPNLMTAKRLAEALGVLLNQNPSILLGLLAEEEQKKEAS